MSMTTYWDLTEAERAALSADDVQRYVDAELMLKGVLKVKPLDLEPVPSTPEPDGRAFVVRTAGKYGRADTSVAFQTLEAAQAFLALHPLNIGSEYLEHASVQFTSPITDPEIAEVPMFTEEGKNAARSDLKRASAIKASNEKRTEAYRVAQATQEEALRGLWEDWTACREREAELRAVADTFADYKRTAGGDEQVAASFLAKVYPSTLIAAAAERFAFQVAS